MDAKDLRALKVTAENVNSLQSVITACGPLFDKPWDVAGDDDAAIITLKYEDWTHLLFTLEPFYPREIKRIEKKLFPPAKQGITP